MALIPWKLIGLMGLIPVSGIGVAYAVIKVLNHNKSLEYKGLSDFKNNCLVSIVGGDRGKSSDTNRKLLVCPVPKNSEKAVFYFYDENTSKEKDNLPKEVQKFTIKGDQKDITLILVDSTEEVISVSNITWNSLKDKNLKEECTVQWEDKEDVKQLKCGNEYPKNLEAFSFK